MERHFAKTKLGQMHYLDAGKASTDPLVLLHQTPRSMDEFTEVIPLLAARHRVLAIDTPGYGCSDRPSEQPTIEEYVAAVIELLDQIGVKRACMIGHHTGAILAFEAAAAYPDRVSKTVVSGLLAMDEEARNELRPFFKQWHVQEDGSHMNEKWGKFAKWIVDPQLRHRAILDLLRAGETSEFGHFAVVDYRMEGKGGLVKAPTLAIWGKDDPFGPTEKNRNFVKTLPDCREVVLEGGIFLPNEHPEAFAGAILDFV
jgi:pimeloyl-ACP methyl ester carboxylesterase